MKRWMIRILLIAGYCVPYISYAMCWDAVYGSMLFYGVALLCFAALFILSVKTKNASLIISGNILSFIASAMFVHPHLLDSWSWYFKPFTAGGLLTTVSVISFLLQLLILFSLRKKQK